MKQFLLLLSLTALVGCMPKLPSIPEIPEVEIPEVEVPEVQIPEVELPEVKSLQLSVEPYRESRGCIAGFVEDTPGKGTLDMYYPSRFSEEIQSIPGVSIKVAQEITDSLGVC